MRKRLTEYLSYLENVNINDLGDTDKSNLLKDLLIQISYFQHERLIHLLVTLTFSLLTVAGIVTSLFVQTISVLILTILFFILLVPYVIHYYFLENGVQKLYTYYDLLK